MDGRKYRFHDNHEYFHTACAVEPNGRGTVRGPSASQSQRRQHEEDDPHPPLVGERRRHLTAGEIAQELGYSVSYVLAVKKAMYLAEATRPRRLDPKEVSEWIYAHPSFRMRDVYEHHPKDREKGQRLLEI
jgi:hypothetical protein